jgi:hypothetical protein
MKKCSHCGKLHPDTARVCEVDGQPLWDANPPPLSGSTPPLMVPIDMQRRTDDEQLKLLAIFHYVFAGFAVLGILLLCAHFAFMTALFTRPEIWNQKNYSGPPPEFFTVFLGAIYFIAGVMTVAGGILNFLSANFIRQRRNHTFSFVVACLNCLQVPLGTALGVFTIVVLSRPSVRAQYGK